MKSKKQKKDELSIRRQHLQSVIETVNIAIEVSSGVKIITIARRKGVSGTNISQKNQKGLKYGAKHGSLQTALDIATAALAGLPALYSPEIKGSVKREANKAAPAEVLQRSIETLELSCRATTCLFNAGITNIGELISTNKMELLKRKNFGIKSLFEINQALSELGLCII